MNSIHFFDTAEADATALRPLAAQLLPTGQAVTFHATPATPLPEATIISPFVTSRITADMMAAMPHLKLIACRSTGYDHIDLAAAKDHGVKICNVPSYGENTVAEYAFGLLLALVRKIPQAVDQLRHGSTIHHNLQGTDLMGKTLGLIGAGRIGCHMAAIGRGFGMKVVAFDPHADPQRAAQYGFTYEPFEQVLTTADVLSLHVPNIPKTKHLLDAAALAKMKPAAVVVNTARGEVINTRALIEALTKGHIAGAALDVFEGERVVSVDAELDQLRAEAVDRLVLEHNFELSILQKLPNVILTNHNAFNSLEAVQRINQTTLENIAAFLTSGTPTNEVNAT